MLFESRAHAGRRLRLAYCMNLHAASDLESLLRGMREVSLPLRARLAPRAEFGVGMYLPGQLARELAAPAGAAQLERLREFLLENGLCAFTFNAFPYGGFQTDGLKAEVYRPSWFEEERVAYTLAVAHCASVLAAGRRLPRVSISTHPGSFGAWVEPGALERCADNMGRVVAAFARLEREGGARLVLSLEAEPRASAGDSSELQAFLSMARARIARTLAREHGQDSARALLRRHLGVCLDTCHSAIAFEEPTRALELALSDEGTLGKIQYSSALRLEAPGSHPEEVAALLALDEPRFLHQVVGRRAGASGHLGDGGVSPADLLSVADLPELASVLAAGVEAADALDGLDASDAPDVSDAPDTPDRPDVLDAPGAPDASASRASETRSDVASSTTLAADAPRVAASAGDLSRAEAPQESDAALSAAHRASLREAWLACDEWRCHFHVPVDRERMEVPGSQSRSGADDSPEVTLQSHLASHPHPHPASRSHLGTTRGHAARILETALAEPAVFASEELHVEIETYTWDVLPRAVRTPAALVDALELEYRSVLDLLAAQGWTPAP